MQRNKKKNLYIETSDSWDGHGVYIPLNEIDNFISQLQKIKAESIEYCIEQSQFCYDEDKEVIVEEYD